MSDQTQSQISRIASLLAGYGLSQGDAVDAARTIVLIAIKR